MFSSVLQVYIPCLFEVKCTVLHKPVPATFINLNLSDKKNTVFQNTQINFIIALTRRRYLRAILYKINESLIVSNFALLKCI